MGRIQLAKAIFNSGTTPVNNTLATPSKGNTNIGGSTSVRFGTVIAVNGDGSYQIRLTGSNTVITATSEALLTVGQGVRIIYQNGRYVVIGLSNQINSFNNEIAELIDEDKKLREEIANKGQEIIDSVQADIGEVQTAVDNAVQKADEAYNSVSNITTTVEGLEDEVGSFSTKISGAVETANEALTVATTAKQDLDGFKTTVSSTYETKADADAAIAQEVLDRNSAIEQSAAQITTSVSQNYQSKTDAGTMKSDLETKINQNANAITTEVNNRVEAVSGAIQESKSYTDQQADSIATTVEESVMNSVGETYVTKNEFEITSEGFTSTITSAVDTANSAKDAANAAQSTANTANSTANSAKTAATNAAKTATDYLSYSSSGLKIGNKNIDTSVNITSTDIEFNAGTTKLANFGANGANLYYYGDGTYSNPDSELRLNGQGIGFWMDGYEAIKIYGNNGPVPPQTVIDAEGLFSLFGSSEVWINSPRISLQPSKANQVYLTRTDNIDYIVGNYKVLYNGSAVTTASLSLSSSKFSFVKVFVQSGGGNITSVDIIPGKTGVATVYDNAATSWVAFVRVTVSGSSARIASELNMPVSAYNFGSGNTSIDARIIRVEGWN